MVEKLRGFDKCGYVQKLFLSNFNKLLSFINCKIENNAIYLKIHHGYKYLD